MNALLRYLFFLVVVRPVVLIILGINARHRQRLPTQGPAILIANHNSHLDTMVLFTLLPLRLLPRIRPVAAMDYFLRNTILAWFSLNIIGILPIRRSKDPENPEYDVLTPCHEALEKGDILI